MDTDYIALAIPFFFLLIGIELIVARRRGKTYYRLNDAVNDLSCGIVEQLAVLLCAAFLLAGYSAIYSHFRLFELTAGSAWTWIGCFVLLDLVYYWFHRLSHEVNFLWAAHIVHHQSEEYNLAVALRQSTVQPFFSMAFYWSLALIGFPPAVFAACASFNLLYQFWIHTRTIDRLGPLEWILMTPSHHRVHHGRNPIYIDRNHGGTFIVWDMLFGTYQREEEQVAYGITKPLASWNPIWANLHYWRELVQSAQRTRSWRDKLLVFLKPPGWQPEDLGGFQPAPAIEWPPEKFDPPVSRGVSVYALLQFGQILIGAALLLLEGASAPLGLQAAAAFAITWGLTNLGALFEGRGWAARSELLRLALTPVLVLIAFPSGAGLLAALALALNFLPASRLGLGWQSEETPAHPAGGVSARD